MGEVVDTLSAEMIFRSWEPSVEERVDILSILTYIEGSCLDFSDGKRYVVSKGNRNWRRVLLVCEHEMRDTRYALIDDVFRYFVLTHSELKGQDPVVRKPKRNLKQMALAICQESRFWRIKRICIKKEFCKETKKGQKLLQKIKVHKSLEEKWGTAHSLPECRDNHTLETLDGQYKSHQARLEDCKSKLDALKGEKPAFPTLASVCDFFTRCLHVSLPYVTLYSWVQRGQVARNAGRPIVLSGAMEKYLVKVILEADSRGTPMSRSQIMDLANSMVESEKIRAQRGANGLTLRWFKAFMTRMKVIFPELVEVKTRAASVGTADWFNSPNINWWFDTVKRIAIEHGFAEAVEGNPEEELRWLAPERVVITDETCVSGGIYRKVGAFHKDQKVVSTKTNLSIESRRRSVLKNGGEYGEHITLVAGHNLVGEPTMPVWVFSAERDIRNRAEIENAAVTTLRSPAGSTPLPPINAQRWDKVLVTCSKNGGIVQENIGIMLEGWKLMFPDLANENGKRVLWFTDWHASRLSVPFLEELRENGVVLVGWLPMCTSLMQSPDTTLFGPFKNARDAIEQEQRRSGLFCLVSPRSWRPLWPW